MHGRIYACLTGVALLVACAITVPVSAQPTDAGQQFALLSKPQVSSRHIDLFYRDAAVRSHEAGGRKRALSLFLKAASFADKPSQAIIATMYWNGDGVPQDRALASGWIGVVRACFRKMRPTPSDCFPGWFR